MNFTGFTFNDSASLPRESLDHVYDRNNAYSAVFDQHSSGYFVSSQDPGNSHRHAHDFLRSGLKAGANQLIDETEVVTESVAQHKYSQLANASYLDPQHARPTTTAREEVPIHKRCLRQNKIEPYSK